MARPFWLKLFGGNGGMTIDEIRTSFLDLGARVADADRIVARVARISDRTDSLTGATHQPVIADPTPREQASLAAATIADAELHATGPALSDAITPTTAAVPEQSAAELAGGDDGRSSSLFLNGVAQTLHGLSAPNAIDGRDLAPNYVILYTDDIMAGAVVDANTKTLLQGGPGDYPQLGAGPNDTLELNGDYSAGFTLSVPAFVDQIVAREGNDYNLIADDASVAPGATLTINAMPLRADNRMIFDGSAETDGRFVFFGSEANDVFLGGAGNDRIQGLGGGDTLSGGGGSDTFVYTGAGESTGPNYDTLADFDPSTDRIDLLTPVTGFGTTIEAGTLSQASFDDDLGAALGGLGATQAVWFSPDAGDLAGQIFLIVDANGIAGYQAGEDYVFAVAGSPLTDLTGHTGFFF